MSDNGTQFKSAMFDEFKAEHTTSSLHHHLANGSAESGVRISKRIPEQEDPFLTRLAYHATPVPATGKTSPELIMGKQIRTTIPTMAKVSEPKLPHHTAVKKADVIAKRCYKESFDRRNGTRELPPLQPGYWVRVKLDSEKQWTTESKVISTDQSPRSCILDSGGRMLRRNQKHLIKFLTPTCHDTPEENFRFQKSLESLFPKMSQQRIPKFRKTATPVPRAIITQS